MALYIDGFEQFDKADSPGSEMRLAGYEVVGSIQTGTGRKGGRSLVLSSSSVAKAWEWSEDMFSVGFAVKFTTRGPLLEMSGGILLTLDKLSGRPVFNGINGNAGPVKDRWYYVEVRLRRGARAIDLFFNGKLDTTVTMSEEVAANTSMICRLNPFDKAGIDGDSGTRNYDDFYMNNGDTAKPIQITTRFPDKDADPNEWAPSEGPTADHFAMVGKLPTDKLDRYLIGNVSGAEESFTSSTLLPDDNRIVAIGLVSLLRKTTVDNLTVTARFDGRDVLISDIPMEWQYRYTQFPLDGDTKSSIEGAEFGVVLNRNN